MNLEKSQKGRFDSFIRPIFDLDNRILRNWFKIEQKRLSELNV